MMIIAWCGGPESSRRTASSHPTPSLHAQAKHRGMVWKMIQDRGPILSGAPNRPFDKVLGTGTTEHRPIAASLFLAVIEEELAASTAQYFIFVMLRVETLRKIHRIQRFRPLIE